MNWAYGALLGIAGITVVFFGGFGLGYRLDDAKWQKQSSSQVASAQKRAEAVATVNQSLSADKATLTAKVNDLQQQIANQKPETRIVYVHPKPTASNPVPAPTAVTGPVYVTAGAVGLFNAAFGLSQTTSASGIDNGTAGELPSAVTISDYISTTEYNATACYANQQQVILLQRYIQALD